MTRIPSSLGAVHHLAVCVTSLTDAENFYVGVLGLEVWRRHRRDDGSQRAIWLGLGGDSFLALEQVHDGVGRQDATVGWHCVALRIDRADRAAWAAHLQRAGVPIERTTDYTLYVRDPDGSLVALSHYPEAI